MATHEQAVEDLVLPDGTRLIRQLGQGKFARVFEARTADGAPVAVKLLQRTDEQAVRRFQREIKVMRELPANPHCVAYRAHGELPDGTPWVAMELVEGFALSAVTKSGKRVPVRTACALIAQVCDGFQGLHSLGLTHRDIAPNNILITRRDHQVKIIDFGLVQDSQGILSLYEQEEILEGSDFCDDLDVGLIAGAAEYMAPEQITDPHEAATAKRRTDTPADVFALAAVFYQLVAGTQLFSYAQGSGGIGGRKGMLNYFDYRMSFRDEDLICPDEVDAPLWSIVRKALRSDPRQRQGSASQLARDLRFYLQTGRGVIEDVDEKTAIAHRPYTEALAPSAMSAADFERVQALATDVSVKPISDREAVHGRVRPREAPQRHDDPDVDQDKIETSVDDRLPPQTLRQLRRMMVNAESHAASDRRSRGKALKIALVVVLAGAFAAVAVLIVLLAGGG